MSPHLQPVLPVQDPPDDGQLTIRIPNPKVYMARQSQWIGRRGKARCDNCRSSNLKCDRVLPRCNHCSWANQAECRYTPLPTPAHRGIPRCDRCRVANMKCDRNLPICNNCEASAAGTSCHYTPKKKQKSGPSEDDASAVSRKNSEEQDNSFQIKGNTPSKLEVHDPKSHTFYGRNVGTPESQTVTPGSSGSGPTAKKEFSQTGRFTAYEHTGTGFFSRPFLSIPLYPLTTPFEFVPHSFSPQNRLASNNSIIEPWTKPSFLPLPKFVSQSLRQLNVAEFPKRIDFDSALSKFQVGILEAHKETMYIPAEKYVKILSCIAKGDTSTLSKPLQAWVAVHKLCSGSENFNLILVPRETAFHMKQAIADEHRQQFLAHLQNGNVEDLKVHHYDVLPVMEQVYDILTYAHRSHHSAAQMLVEIINLRYAFVTWTMAEIYVNLCPTCNMEQEDDCSTSRSPGPST